MAGVLSSAVHGNPIARIVSGSNPNRPLFFHRPLAVAVSTTHQSYWSSVNADIDAHLNKSIPSKPPLVVFEPMRHLTFSAPQTTAPALCIAACELVGGHRDQAIAAASALHLMHASAFTHENLPLTERPKPTFDHTYGPNIRLLMADGMIAFGFELLARADNNSNRVLRAIIEISRAMGTQGVMAGQYNESQLGESDGTEAFHVGWLHNVCSKKGGVLHACAGACGATLGGGSEEEIEKLRRYGLYVGTIQGILNRVEKNEWSIKEVKELRVLGLRELKDFNQEKVRTISSLVETYF
ncbi:geranylgeranyl pyrophosphate synthase 11, chloroplastic [Manihot esculenta]|uniref:geranylgeranyl pyrophosphate synthase 11, chloroplastic n=1 Tax=Manihot esculenta TaxID=3983 RepID=UPI001CC53275|nr:geranylgeranyl pyrophosphate synthase 11, chloroplastic [Manihot esculenta]